MNRYRGDETDPPEYEEIPDDRQEAWEAKLMDLDLQDPDQDACGELWEP